MRLVRSLLVGGCLVMAVTVTGKAHAGCMTREGPRLFKAEIHVPDGEEQAYVSLGYVPSVCAADENLQRRVNDACRFAAIFPKAQWPLFADRFGTTPDRLCVSARALAADKGLVVDASEHLPDWLIEKRAEEKAMIDGVASGNRTSEAQP